MALPTRLLCASRLVPRLRQVRDRRRARALRRPSPPRGGGSSNPTGSHPVGRMAVHMAVHDRWLRGVNMPVMALPTGLLGASRLVPRLRQVRDRRRARALRRPSPPRGGGSSNPTGSHPVGRMAVHMAVHDRWLRGVNMPVMALPTGLLGASRLVPRLRQVRDRRRARALRRPSPPRGGGSSNPTGSHPVGRMAVHMAVHDRWLRGVNMPVMALPTGLLGASRLVPRLRQVRDRRRARALRRPSPPRGGGSSNPTGSHPVGRMAVHMAVHDRWLRGVNMPVMALPTGLLGASRLVPRLRQVRDRRRARALRRPSPPRGGGSSNPTGSHPVGRMAVHMAVHDRWLRGVNMPVMALPTGLLGASRLVPRLRQVRDRRRARALRRPSPPRRGGSSNPTGSHPVGRMAVHMAVHDRWLRGVNMPVMALPTGLLGASRLVPRLRQVRDRRRARALRRPSPPRGGGSSNPTGSHPVGRMAVHMAVHDRWLRGVNMPVMALPTGFEPVLQP